MLRSLKQIKPEIEVIVLCQKASFDFALEAWRAGAADMVLKTADAVEYLVERVAGLSRGVRRLSENKRLFAEVLKMHEGHQGRAAKALGLKYTTFRFRAKKVGALKNQNR